MKKFSCLALWVHHRIEMLLLLGDSVQCMLIFCFFVGWKNASLGHFCAKNAVRYVEYEAELTLSLYLQQNASNLCLPMKNA